MPNSAEPTGRRFRFGRVRTAEPEESAPTPQEGGRRFRFGRVRPADTGSETPSIGPETPDILPPRPAGAALVERTPPEAPEPEVPGWDDKLYEGAKSLRKKVTESPAGKAIADASTVMMNPGLGLLTAVGRQLRPKDEEPEEDTAPATPTAEGVVTLQRDVARKGKQEDVDVDVTGTSPRMKEVLTNWDDISPLTEEGLEVPHDKLQYPLLQFTTQPKFLQFEEEQEAWNLPAVASKMRSVVRKEELLRLGLSDDPVDEKEREAFYEEIHKKTREEIHHAISQGFAFGDVDPDEVSRQIAEGNYGLIGKVLSRGMKGVLGDKWGEELYEATWAPVEAVLTPATTIDMMDRQGPKQTQQHLVWHYLNASTGALGSWFLSDDPNLDFGSPEHIKIIRSGYNLFDDYHKLGKEIMDLPAMKPSQAMARAVFGEKHATRNEQVAGFMSTLALDWGVLDLGLALVGKGADALRLTERLGIGKAGTLATAKKAVDDLDEGIANGTVKDFKQVSEALGGEASAARQFFYGEFSARVAKEDRTFRSGALDAQLKKLPELVAKAQKLEADAVVARGGRAAAQAAEAALKGQERMYESILTINRARHQRALGVQRGLEQLHPTADFGMRSAKARAQLRKKAAALGKVAKDIAKLTQRAGTLTPSQESRLRGLYSRQGALTLEHTAAKVQILVSDAAKATAHEAKAIKSAEKKLKKVKKRLGKPRAKLDRIGRIEAAAAAKAADVARVQQYLPIAREVLQSMSRGYGAGLKVVRETPGFTRFVDKPYQGVLPQLTAKGADKAGTSLDPQAVLLALETAYGKGALAKFRKGESTALHRFLGSPPGLTRLTPEVLAELHAAERTLAKQARGAMLTDQGLIPAQRLLDEAGELAIRSGTLSVTSPKTWKPAMQRAARAAFRVLEAMTPGNRPIQRLGPMSKEMRGAYTRTVNWLLRAKDEQKALVDYALKNNIPFGEAIARYLDQGLELVLPTGKSVINRGPMTIPKTAFKTIRELPITQLLVKGEDIGEAELPAFFDALARMWLPDQTLKQEVRLDAGDANKLRTRMAKLIVNGGDTLEWGGPNGFAEQMRKATQQVMRGGAAYEKDNKSLLFGLQALTSAAMRHRLAEDIYKTVGSVSDDTARRLKLMMKGKGQGLAKDVTELEDLYEKLVAFGMPTFAHREVKTNFADARKIAGTIDAVIKRQTETGELVFIPNPILHALEAKQEDIAKTLAQYSPKAEASVIGRGWEMLQGVMSVWRQDHVTGIGLPRAAHFVMTAASDFAQMGMSLGWGTAARLSFQNGLTNLPMVGGRYQDFASQLSRKYGDKYPIMATPLNALMNPHLAAVWRNEDRLIQTLSGEVINLKDVLKWATEDGVMETFYRFDQQEVVAKVTGRLDKQQVFGIPGTGTARAAWSQAREIPSTIMSVVQQRQRMGVYLEYLVNRGAGREGAKKAVDEALYDWTHGVSEWELATISKVAAFYRYLRLSTNSIANIYGDLLRAPTAENLGKVQRLRQMMEVSIHGPQTFEEFAAASPDRDELLNDHEQYKEFVNSPANKPQWLQGIGITSPARELDEKRRRHLARSEPGTTRSDPTHYVTRYPSLGPPEAFEMWLNIANGVYGSMKLLGKPVGLSTGVPDEWYDATAKPFTEIFMPGVQTMLEAGLDAGIGTDLDYTSKKFSRGEETLFEGVKDWVPSGFFDWVGKDEWSGRPQWESNFLKIFFRQVPVLSTAAVRQAEAWGGAPEDATWAEEFDQVYQVFTGIKDVPYSPLAEHDKAVESRFRRIEERRKRKERSLGLQGLDDEERANR